MKITREQFNKWDAQVKKLAGAAWGFDLNKYCLWGEKTVINQEAIENGEYIQKKVVYYPEFERVTNCHNVTYNRETGRYIPTLLVNHLYPLESGLYRVIEVERREIGAAQEKKNFNNLCKAAAAV